MSSWTIRLDWPRPPLTSNQRLTHFPKARITKRVRAAARIDAEYRSRIPQLGYCRVTLTWVVNTHHRRDADNVTPTLKALCDGLVDAGIVPDDTPEFMDKIMPVIRYDKAAQPHLELLIEQVDRPAT